MRREGWDRFLTDYIAASQNTPFEWGRNDCCLWVGRYVDYVRGSNLASRWVGAYNTASGADQVLRLIGFKNAADMADAYLPRKNISTASRGDVVMIGGALGICAGRRSYFFIEERGLSALPTLKCAAAWEV